MSEVFFYHLERQSLEQLLPLLLEKTLERDWRAVVQAVSAERVESLDKLLWTWREDNFMPHAHAGDARFADSAASQPIWLTSSDDRPNDAQVLFLVDGAMRDRFDGFERCVSIFDGRDSDALANARNHWKKLQAAGHALTYWQQNAGGQWEKQAQA